MGEKITRDAFEEEIDRYFGEGEGQGLWDMVNAFYAAAATHSRERHD